MSRAKRSALMARIRGKNTGIELVVLGELRKRSLKPRRYVKTLPGRPDLVFPESRLAIFLDGDFWHGWRFPRWSGKLSSFWREKIQKNRLRDQRNFRRLRRMGWRVVRVWEHQIRRDLSACVRRILTGRVGRARRVTATREAR